MELVDCPLCGTLMSWIVWKLNPLTKKYELLKELICPNSKCHLSIPSDVVK